MYSALLILYLVVSIALIAFILLQQGKGADAGASFGGGVIRYRVRCMPVQVTSF